MIIKCWGSRGSIPVTGSEYLRYGGDTTCIEIRTKNDKIIIIDAGTGIRKLGNKLINEDRYNYFMIFTHAHWDHLLGFPFFKPIYISKTDIKIYGCPFAQKSISEMLSKTMSPPYFPVKFEEAKSNIEFNGICDGSFIIDSILVTPIFLNHPNQGLGYKFEEDGKCFVFLTDNELTYKHPGGLAYQDYLNFSLNADVLIHDAEYTMDEYTTTKGWGHSVFNDALQLALDANVKRFGLFHINQDRTDAAVDDMVKTCRKITNTSNLECFAVNAGLEIVL
ncbi:MAG: MBL fold metallo-hydrolase [Spirochaetota bacterium]|nr:MBL fold metallo-hydrolase [Spirochaetota bacterium]